MKKQTCSLAAITCAVLLPAMSWAQTYVNETFDYADDAALLTKWSNSTGLSLDTAAGNPAPSAGHSGTASAHSWIGSAFSITPTDAAPLVLSGDLWYSGLNNQRNTIGLRTGANPLFEIGFYNQAGANGLSVRLLNIGGVGGSWIELASYASLGTTPQWIRVETTFTSKAATVTWDLEADATIDGTQNWTGTLDVLPFSDLRFGGPSGVSSTSGFAVDNIMLEVIVPEPSMAALLGLGLSGLIAFRRSRN